jgi:hypothetical protein
MAVLLSCRDFRKNAMSWSDKNEGSNRSVASEDYSLPAYGNTNPNSTTSPLTSRTSLGWEALDSKMKA